MAPIVKNIILNISFIKSLSPVSIKHAIETLNAATPISILARYIFRLLHFSLSTRQQIMAPIVKNIILKIDFIASSSIISVRHAIEPLNAATPISILTRYVFRLLHFSLSTRQQIMVLIAKNIILKINIITSIITLLRSRATLSLSASSDSFESKYLIFKGVLYIPPH